jgi:hypothetical protein
LSSFAVAVVATRAGGVPAVVNWADRAIEKQPSWAAAISSSGLVPVFERLLSVSAALARGYAGGGAGATQRPKAVTYSR